MNATYFTPDGFVPELSPVSLFIADETTALETMLDAISDRVSEELGFELCDDEIVFDEGVAGLLDTAFDEGD